MEITKTNGKFNVYRLEISYGELVCLETALADNHAGPVADELYAGLNWYLSNNLPKPGEETEAEKNKREKAENGGDVPKGEKDPADAMIDDPGAGGPGGANEEPAGGAARADAGPGAGAEKPFDLETPDPTEAPSGPPAGAGEDDNEADAMIGRP